MSKKEQELSVYITNLLVEAIPSNQMNQKILDEFDLVRSNDYVVLQVLLSNNLQNTIDGQKIEDVTVWKETFHEVMMEHLGGDDVKVISMMTLQPMIRTIILSLVHKEQSIYNDLKACFKQMVNALEDQYQTSVTGCYGMIVDDFFKLGMSYKSARKLQNYHYLIGLGQSLFYSDLQANDDISLVEYKYLHLYERLLEKKDWVSLYELLNTIKETLIKHFIPDSKTSYIYKEIFSVTIRYLFNQNESFNEEISILNDGIIMFDMRFNDLNEIHDYYMTVFETISNQHAHSGMHPYIRKTLLIIQNEYQQPINLASISDRLGLSNAYLSRLFKAEMDLNLKAYLISYRIEKAKALLKETDYQINVIREMVGYQTPTQFVRVFKKSEGMTPSDYRSYHIKHQ